MWFIQRGSPESKKPGDEGIGTDEEQLVGEHARPDSPRWAKVRGVRLWVYSNSLLLTMGSIFLLSWFAQALAGHVVANEENIEHGVPLETLGEYIVSPEFWNRTLQNWQSEFRRRDGGVLDLSASTRIERIEAGGNAAPREFRGSRITPSCRGREAGRKGENHEP